MVDAIAKIESLTGITATQWMNWFNRKPRYMQRECIRT